MSRARIEIGEGHELLRSGLLVPTYSLCSCRNSSDRVTFSL